MSAEEGCRQVSWTWPPWRRALNNSPLGFGGQMVAPMSTSSSSNCGEEINILFCSTDIKGSIPPLHHFKTRRRVKCNYLNSIFVFVIGAINWRRGGRVLIPAAEELRGRRGKSSCAGSETEPHSSCLCWTVWWIMWQRHSSISISPLITRLIFTHQETC